MYDDVDGDLQAVYLALKSEKGGDAYRIARHGVRVLAMLLRKNSDYGSSVFQTPILAPCLPAKTAILVRMSDKIARFNNLSQLSKEACVDESLDETIDDFAGYAILYGVPDEDVRD